MSMGKGNCSSGSSARVGLSDHCDTGSENDVDWEHPPEIQQKLSALLENFGCFMPALGSPITGSWGGICIDKLSGSQEIDYTLFTCSTHAFHLMQWRQFTSSTISEEELQRGKTILTWFLDLDKAAR